MPEAWWMYPALGLLAGMVSATFGVGAGVVMVPALVLLPAFGLKQQSAQGISLCVMVPMALVGAWRYIQDPTIEVDLRLAGLIAVGAVVGAYFGQQLASRLPATTLRRAFAVFMLVVAVRMFFTSGRSRPTTPLVSQPTIQQQSFPTEETTDER